MLSALARSILGIALIVTALSAEAAPKTVPCPPVVVDKSSGIYFPGKHFRCYKTAKQAKSSGYTSKQATAAKNFTGWWRFGIAPVSDTCGDLAPQDWSPLTVFLQLKHSSNGLFAKMCPGTSRFIGSTEVSGNGFVVSSIESLQHDAQCNGGTAEVRYVFEAKAIDNKLSKASSVRYTKIKTCSTPLDSSFQCSTVWAGNGVRETPNHLFWPTVPDNLNAFGASCSEALTNCSGCHSGL